jgi:hypothetical protein
MKLMKMMMAVAAFALAIGSVNAQGFNVAHRARPGEEPSSLPTLPPGAIIVPPHTDESESQTSFNLGYDAGKKYPVNLKFADVDKVAKVEAAKAVRRGAIRRDKYILNAFIWGWTEGAWQNPNIIR